MKTPRTARRAALLTATVLALGLTACGSTEPTPVAADPATTPAVQAPPAPSLACPATLTYLPVQGAAVQPGSVRTSVGVPDEALLCTYTPGLDGAAWSQSGEAVTLGPARRAKIFGHLSWRPQPQDKPCTMDLGPVSLLTWHDGENVTSLAMENFGCRHTYLLTDVTEPSREEALELPARVQGLIAARD